MTRQMTWRTKAGVFAFLIFVTLALAGCGSHDQAGGSSGTMTPQQIQQNAQKQNQPPSGQTAPSAQTAPAGH